MSLIIPLLSLAGFAVVAVMRVLDPLLPVVANEFEVSVGTTAVIVTAFALPYGLCQLMYGPLGDRVGKLRVITAALGLTALSIFACGFAASVPQLATLRFISGITCAGIVPLTLAFIGDHIDYSARQNALGRYMSVVILGQIAGAGIGGILVDLIGWRAIFWSFGMATGIVALILRWGTTQSATAPQVRVSMRTAISRYRRLAANPHARDVLIAAFVEGFCLYAGLTFIGAMLHQRHDLKMTTVGLFLICLGLGSLLYTLSVRWLVRTLGQRVMVVLGGAFMAQAFILLGMAQDWRLCAPLLVLLGFGMYLMHNTLQTLATELAPDARGTAVALFVFTLFSGQGLGVLVFGRMIDHVGYAIPFETIGVALGLLGLWMRGSRSLGVRAH